MRQLILLVALFSGLASGCARPMAEARQAYDEARYPEAADELRRLESARRDWNRAGQVRYALYRGLTYLAVGDAHAANAWLTEVKREWEQDNDLLNHRDRGRLLSAWRSLGHMPGQ